MSAWPRALVVVHEPGGGSAVLGRQLAARGWQLHDHLVTADLQAPSEAAPFPDWRGYDLIVSMGSVRSVYDRETIGNWIDGELDLLGQAHEAGVAVLGVCFGAQALAAALGGEVNASPSLEIGWHEIGGDSNPLGAGPWFQWHHDRLIPPLDAEVLATTTDNVQLFTAGRSVGVQFHPEVDVEHIAAWLAIAPDAYLEEVGVDRQRFLAQAKRWQATSAAGCRRLVDWYLDEVGLG